MHRTLTTTIQWLSSHLRRLKPTANPPAEKEPERRVPHYVADYERLVETLKANFPLDEAMAHAVGGAYEHTGEIERAILDYAGLSDGMRLVDIGCGSGRLAAALVGRKINYLGTDVVQDLLDYARQKSDPGFAFVRHLELTLPVPAATIDIACAFSVFTHLLHEESYLYLQDGYRALRPGGTFVFSFLEFADPLHWSVFASTVDARQRGALAYLNVFNERATTRLWAQNVGFRDPEFVDGSAAPWAGRPLGQSIAILRKP